MGKVFIIIEKGTDMKIQIRHGVFETNSSSQHSLCIMKNGGKYTPEEIMRDIWLWDDNETGEKNCRWNLWDEECLYFGRSPYRAIHTFAKKWRYACAALVKEYNDDIYKELVRIAMKYIPGLKRIDLPKKELTIYNKEYSKYIGEKYYQVYGKTGKEMEDFILQKEEDYDMELPVTEWLDDNDECESWTYIAPLTGMVDEDILSGFLQKEGISLEEFLINKKYIVIQDGDEYNYFRDMKDCNLINMEAIDHEYFNYPENNETED